MQIEFLMDRERALIGQKADATPAVVVSTTSHAASSIPFGVLVVFDDNDPLLCKIPTNKTQVDKPVGITLRQLHCNKYESKSTIAALRKGRVWVQSDKVDAPSDPVFLKFLEDGSYVFTGMKTGNTQLRGAIFLEKTEGGKVPIEVNFFWGVQ
jgi:hypothetical protein